MTLQGHDGIETGFNTSSGTPLDTKSGGENLLVSRLQQFTIDSQDYFRLFLNTNEPGARRASSISLDQLMIFRSENPAMASDMLSSFGTPIYDLDSAGDISLLLRDNNNGAGKVDLIVDVAANLLQSGSGDYLIVYSSLGAEGSATGGPEVWSAALKSIPEPQVLGAFVMAAALIKRARR